MSIRLTAVALAFAFAALPRSVQAQQLTQSGYPNAEKRLELAPGESIVLLNRILNDGGPATRPPGRRLDLQYSTAIPAADSLARMEQADRAAQVFGPDAVAIGVRRLSIGICDTRACAERRDPPATWYLYERTANGWRRSRF
jgi:hypothetical protein